MSGHRTALTFLYEREGLASGQLQSISDPTGCSLFFDKVVAKATNVVFQVNAFTYNMRFRTKQDTYLKGTDAIIFFWDSEKSQWEENIRSFKEVINHYGNKVLSTDGNRTPPEVPVIICANKRDLPNITSIDRIKEVLRAGKMPNTVIFETVAITGTNVKRAFVFAARECVLRHYQKLKGGISVSAPSEEPEEGSPVIEAQPFNKVTLIEEPPFVINLK
jgi:hypothetical protein